MRNFKKFLALVLAMLMVVSAAATVSAFEDVAEDNQFAEAIADLNVLDIVNGYDETTFGPEDAVTRQQFALMMARAITGITDDAEWAKGGLVAFDDVAEYQYAIATVVKAGIVDGFLDNTFRPEEGVTFIQALKMAVCALGYGEGLEWWQGYYNVALDLGLTDNLNQITDKDQALNRGEVAQLIYNMIYATAANGSSLAYDIFGIGVEEPVVEPATETTLVVTATTKQYATENIDVAEGGFVGVQEIVNGVPAGEVYYIDIEALGFEDDAAAEAAYLSAYNFYNWDAETATFDAAEVTGLVEVITNADVTVNYANDKKIKINGATYYPVEETTGTAIKNEIVIFNADEHLYRHTDKILGIAKDGFVYKWMDKDADGVYAWEQVLEAIYNRGELVYYKDLINGGFLTEDKAVAKYGEVESDYEVSLKILAVEDLFEVPAYQMTLYDDNMDGKWDRAYTTTIYVSAHDTTPKDGKYEYGPMKRDDDANTNGKKDNFAVTWVDVEGNEVELAQGDVYKYTYNWLTNTVTVLETYEIQYGTIDRIYTVNDKSSADYVVDIRIDGENYILGNSFRDAEGLDGFRLIDANTNVNALANLKGLKNDGGDFVTDKVASIGYTYDSNFAPENFKAKSYVGFVAVDNVILVMEVIADDNNFKRALFEDFVDYDTEAIYLELWVDGVVDEYAVTRIQKENGKYADIADLSTKELMKAYNYYLSADVGDLYKFVENDEGVTLSRAMDDEVVNVASEKTTSAGKVTTNDYKLAWFDQTPARKIVFEDGIGDYYDTTDDVYALRTSASTLFYFVNTKDDSIVTFKGIPSDSWYIDGAATVYADKLGFTNSNSAIAGAASTVVVYYNNINQIGGFSVSGIETKLVYMTTADDGYRGYVGSDADYFNPYENFNGYELNLDRQYWDEEFYLYNTKAGIDLLTGKAVSSFYVNEDVILKPGYVYWMTNDNIILEAGVTLAAAAESTAYPIVKHATAVTNNLVTDGRNKTTVVTGATVFDEYYAMLADTNNGNIKSSEADIDKLVKDVNKTVYYVANIGASKNVFVALLAGYTAPAAANATYTYNTTEFDVFVTGGTDGKLKDIVVSSEDFDFTVNDILLDSITSFRVTKDDDNTTVDHSKYGYKASITADGDLKFSIYRETYAGDEYMTLEAGHIYRVVVGFTAATTGDTATRTLDFMLTVPAAN